MGKGERSKTTAPSEICSFATTRGSVVLSCLRASGDVVSNKCRIVVMRTPVLICVCILRCWTQPRRLAGALLFSKALCNAGRYHCRRTYTIELGSRVEGASNSVDAQVAVVGGRNRLVSMSRPSLRFRTVSLLSSQPWDRDSVEFWCGMRHKC